MRSLNRYLLVLAFLTAACGGADRPVHKPMPPEPRPPDETTGPTVLEVQLILSPVFDLTRIYGILHQDDPAGLESRAASMGIELDLARRVHLAESLEAIQPELEPLVSARYAELGEQSEQARAELEQAWQPINADFSELVQQVTERDWIHPKYTAVVSVFHPGLSDWRGNQVAVGYRLPLINRVRILAHEIALSQVFQLMREKYQPEVLDDWRLWAFSEIMAVFLLDHERLRPHWPDFAPAGEYLASSNYPQLARLEAQLKALFEARTSFSDFLEKAVPLLQAFEQTHAEPEVEKPSDLLNTRPVLLLADNQFNNLHTAPAFLRSSVSDRFKGVSIRPPQLDLFARDLFAWTARELGADRFLLHLGDALNISCTNEWQRFAATMRISTDHGWAMVPGNHDAYYYGNSGGGPEWLHKLMELAKADVTTLWTQACSDEYPPKRKSGLRFTKNLLIDAYVAELQREDNRASWLGGSGALDPCKGRLAKFRTCGYRAEDPSRILRRVLIQKFPEREQHRSFLLQELDLDPDGEVAVRAILLDTIDYPTNPAMVGGALDSAAESACAMLKRLHGTKGPGSVWTKPYGFLCHMADKVESFNAGLTGNLSDVQRRAVDSWLDDLPAGARYVLVGHHPAEGWRPEPLEWLIHHALNDPRFVMYVSAHTHAGEVIRRVDNKGRGWVEVNLGSATDWPPEVRELKVPVDRDKAWELAKVGFPGKLPLTVDNVRRRTAWQSGSPRTSEAPAESPLGASEFADGDNHGCLDRFKKRDYTGYKERGAWTYTAHAAHNATMDILLQTYARMFADLQIDKLPGVGEGRKGLVELAVERAAKLRAHGCGDDPSELSRNCRASMQRHVDWMAELDRRLKEDDRYRAVREAYGVCQALWASEAEGPQGHKR